jgi:hypothetical protein
MYAMDMNSISKKSSLVILGITAIILSRLPFVFFNDPEGPNLLVLSVAAAIVFFVSLATYLFGISNYKRLLTAVFIQVCLVAAFYFILK